jgi:hypothetical protein
MSILMPALSRAKAQAQAVVCSSNLHQWALAFKMFTDDNGGQFTSSFYWMLYMKSYVKRQETQSDLLVCAPGEEPEDEQLAKTKKIFFCPTATKTLAQGGRSPFVAWEHEEDGDITRGSFGLNQWVTLNTGGGRSWELLWKSPNVAGAMYVPMFMDCTQYYNVCPYFSDTPPAYEGEPSSGNDDEMRRVCINRHNMAIDIAFLDFSVQRTKLNKLWDLHWHRNWNPDDAPPPDWPPWLRRIGIE